MVTGRGDEDWIISSCWQLSKTVATVCKNGASGSVKSGPWTSTFQKPQGPFISLLLSDNFSVPSNLQSTNRLILNGEALLDNESPSNETSFAGPLWSNIFSLNSWVKTISLSWSFSAKVAHQAMNARLIILFIEYKLAQRFFLHNDLRPDLLRYRASNPDLFWPFNLCLVPASRVAKYKIRVTTLNLNISSTGFTYFLHVRLSALRSLQIVMYLVDNPSNWIDRKHRFINRLNFVWQHKATARLRNFTADTLWTKAEKTTFSNTFARSDITSVSLYWEPSQSDVDMVKILFWPPWLSWHRQEWSLFLRMCITLICGLDVLHLRQLLIFRWKSLRLKCSGNITSCFWEAPVMSELRFMAPTSPDGLLSIPFILMSCSWDAMERLNSRYRRYIASTTDCDFST